VVSAGTACTRYPCCFDAAAPTTIDAIAVATYSQL
jgi:hypothetical protein